MSTYRVGNHQPQNVYRGEQYIGVMFTAEDAALAVEALNRAEPHYEIRFDGAVTPEEIHKFRSVFRGLLAGQSADSCTCSFLPGGADPACPVHQGHRAHCPPDRPWDEGICDGSGRTCPRHGAVL